MFSFVSALILISGSFSFATEVARTGGAYLSAPPPEDTDSTDDADNSMAAEKICVVGITKGGYPPFVYIYPNGATDGFDVRVISWIAHEAGFKVKYHPKDWANIIPTLKAKEIDMIASAMTITEERKKEIKFTIPYWNISEVLVVRKNSNLQIRTTLANNNKIGVAKGTVAADWIEKNLFKGGKQIELVYYDSEIAAIEDVISGKIAAAAMDDTAARHIAKTKPVKTIGRYGLPDAVLGYAVRKEDTAFLETLDTGISRLMSSLYWRVNKLKYFSRQQKAKKKYGKETFSRKVTRENYIDTAIGYK